MIKRFIIILISGLLLGVAELPGAHADFIRYETSPKDTYNSPTVTPAYDITGIGFATSTNRPDDYLFFIDFAHGLSANAFNDGLGSFAAIFIDLNNDGKEDYSIETDSEPLQAGKYIAGSLVDRRGGSAREINDCLINLVTDLDSKDGFIIFYIPKTCLNFQSTVYVQGYVDHISGDSRDFDFAPSEYWGVNLGSASASPPATTSPSPSASPSSSIRLGDLPSASVGPARALTNPSAVPVDLVALSSTLTKSVVTVLCGESLGSGWSIDVSLSSTNSSAGYRSYIVTNHHVIDECKANRNIAIVLANQSKVSAFVYSWNEANDVAGILTSTFVDPLEWRGPAPQQGWWAGVIGSPLGFPGVLTTGILSSIDASKFVGTTTAPINHGNSGGPVFDRLGRVIGLATAKYVNSEGFGILQGTPLLCNKIITCVNTSQIWTQDKVANTTPTPTQTSTPTPTASPSAISKAKQVIANWNLPSSVSISKERVSFEVSASSDLDVIAISKTENICLVEDSTIIPVAPGKCLVSLSQSGNEMYLPAATRVMILNIVSAVALKKITITCISGKLVKKVTALNPKCPAGYRKK